VLLLIDGRRRLDPAVLFKLCEWAAAVEQTLPLYACFFALLDDATPRSRASLLPVGNCQPLQPKLSAAADDDSGEEPASGL
jgi:hypothetical protein